MWLLLRFFLCFQIWNDDVARCNFCRFTCLGFSLESVGFCLSPNLEVFSYYFYEYSFSFTFFFFLYGTLVIWDWIFCYCPTDLWVFVRFFSVMFLFYSDWVNSVDLSSNSLICALCNSYYWSHPLSIFSYCSFQFYNF